MATTAYTRSTQFRIGDDFFRVDYLASNPDQTGHRHVNYSVFLRGQSLGEFGFDPNGNWGENAIFLDAMGKLGLGKSRRPLPPGTSDLSDSGKEEPAHT